MSKDLDETLGDLVWGFFALLAHGLGCVVYLALWGAALILALMMGSCVLRTVGIL